MFVLGFVGAALALIASACGSGGASQSPTTTGLRPAGSLPSAGHQRVWIMTSKVFDAMAGNRQAAAALAGSVIYVTSARVTVPVDLHDVDVIPTMDFTSEATLASKVDSGSLPHAVRAVMYDNEDWPATPPDERLDPTHFYELAGKVAHAHGLQLVATPGWIPGYKGGPVTPGMTVRPVASAIIPAIAPYADVIDIQAQEFRLQSNLRAYLAWIAPIAKAAKAANPKVIILSGLSATPAGGQATPQQLLDIAKGTEGVVQGWWLNVPSGPHHHDQPYGLAETFLASLGAGTA